LRHTISTAEVARNLTSYIDRVETRGECFVLMRGGRAVAELGPVRSARRLSDLPDLLASLPRLDPEDASAFDDDLSAARIESGTLGRDLLA
jgi:antitoxin (DNA-binding transcriptional repressor) of toxin-antitoxin stability system